MSMETRFFTVKNYEQFQHYKDRSPPWIKFYNSVLDDYAFTRLQDASRSHLLSIWLLASRTGNRIPYDPIWVGQAIKASGPVDLDVLAEAGFIAVEPIATQAVAKRKRSASKTLDQRERESRERVEQRRGEEKDSAPVGAVMVLSEFEDWWQCYPVKIAKGGALKAYNRVRKAGVTQQELISGALRYANDPNRKADYTKHPATWLNQSCWNDEPLPAVGNAINAAFDKLYAEAAVADGRS